MVNKSGMSSPLAPIESKIVSVIIQMSRIRQSLTPIQSIRLINRMIMGTKVQEDLIEWKMKCGLKNHEGTVGAGYWRGFKNVTIIY